MKILLDSNYCINFINMINIVKKNFKPDMNKREFRNKYQEIDGIVKVSCASNSKLAPISFAKIHFDFDNTLYTIFIYNESPPRFEMM